MAKVKSRIAQVEKEAMFRRWFYFSRFLEGLSDGQMEEIALHWRFPDPLPEPLPGDERTRQLGSKEPHSAVGGIRARDFTHHARDE